jgi:hypothetical protein
MAIELSSYTPEQWSKNVPQDLNQNQDCLGDAVT